MNSWNPQNRHVFGCLSFCCLFKCKKGLFCNYSLFGTGIWQKNRRVCGLLSWLRNFQNFLVKVSLSAYAASAIHLQGEAVANAFLSVYDNRGEAVVNQVISQRHE